MDILRKWKSKNGKVGRAVFWRSGHSLNSRTMELIREEDDHEITKHV